MAQRKTFHKSNAEQPTKGPTLLHCIVKNLMLYGANTIGQWTSHSIDQTGSHNTWWSQSYLIIIPPLLWLNDKCPHIRNGHLDCALARGLILCDQVRRGGYGSVHLDLRLRGDGRGKRLERKWDRWNRNDGGLMETEGTLYRAKVKQEEEKSFNKTSSFYISA